MTRPHRLLTDGGTPSDESDAGDADAESDAGDADAEDAEQGGDGESPAPNGLDRSNVEVREAGQAEPADPKWEKPDVDDIPEFETGASEPLTKPADDRDHGGDTASEDPTAGMPNTARSPSDSRIDSEGTEGYVAALELCARLPDDVRLPAQAADLVPAAVEAELEQDIQSFAAAEFDNPSPSVDVLEFVERDDEIWLRLRLGVPTDAFDDLDPTEIRAHALQELEGLL